MLFLFVWFCGCHHPSHGCHAMGDHNLFHSLAVFISPSVVAAWSRQCPLPATTPIYRATLQIAKFEWGPEQGKALQQVQAAGQGVSPLAHPQLQSLRCSVSLTAHGVSTAPIGGHSADLWGVWGKPMFSVGKLMSNCPHGAWVVSKLWAQAGSTLTGFSEQVLILSCAKIKVHKNYSNHEKAEKQKFG